MEMKMRKLIVALGLAGLLAGPAFAAEMDFAAVDTDGNGEISMEEAAAAGWEWTEDQFAAADEDGSGGLNEDEFAAATAE
jgi:hypothetical protein